MLIFWKNLPFSNSGQYQASATRMKHPDEESRKNWENEIMLENVMRDIKKNIKLNRAQGPDGCCSSLYKHFRELFAILEGCQLPET